MSGYVIQVGQEQPGQAIRATPNKKTGDPEGPQMEMYMRVGHHLVFNHVRVWGRRFFMDKTKGKITDDVNFNTSGYKGEIEFLPWETDGGYAIDVRYLDQSRSLDFEYQQIVQKIVINPDQQGAHLILNSGQNKFDTKKDSLKISFLRVHPQNRDSVSRNPNPEIKGFVFFEVTDEHVDKKSIEQIETALEAGNMIKDLSTKEEHIKILFKIMGKRKEFGSTDELSSPLQIYKTLLEYASNYSTDFFYLIGQYKQQVADDFSKAKSYNALDLTKDGHIALEVNGKKHLILSDIKAKGDGMISWMLDHYYEDEVFKATQIFKELVSKLK